MITVVVCLSLVTMTGMLVYVYRHRHRIQYKLYKLTQLLRRRNKTYANVNYKYDCFVSYCDEDRFWVHDVLSKTLEGKYGLNLVLRHRNFMVGSVIVDEIDEGMNNSREIAIVMSNASIKSDWCRHEIETAFVKALQRNKSLIIATVGNLLHDIEHMTTRTIECSITNSAPFGT